MAKEKKEETKGLQSTIDKLNKDFGGGIVTKGSEKLGLQGIIPFGILSLDKITDIGGIPRGRVVEIHGMDGTFKTTFALLAIAEEQKKGGVCVFIDAEYSFSAEYAMSLGVDIDALILGHPESMEKAYEMIDRFSTSGEVTLIVLDSMTSLSPETELANDYGASNMGVASRINGQFFRKVTNKLGTNNCTLIVLNQLREKLGGYVVTKTVPGGNAILFFASMRLEISKSQIKKDDQIVGITLKIRVIKNKLGVPYQTTELDVIFGQGIDRIKDLIGPAVELGFISKGGAGWYKINEDLKIQGDENLKKHFLDNPEFMEELTNRINAYINNK